ncbi:MAG: N-acetylmuramoyl-L-alanine amidase [Oscillospiraceae bacterium]|nr:N-acetylmuramoyl-L-alanine amidase [Oscillospiraceae bacterium]
MNKKVCIDMGHGGTDPGAVSGNRQEKDDNLRIGMKVISILQQQGIGIVVPRDVDKTVSLQARSNLANDQKVDLCVSLHRNSFSSGQAKGVEIWTQKGVNDATTNALAANILEGILSEGVSANRGVKLGDYHITRETNMPACLVELGFITNSEDNQLFDSKIDGYALAISKGILKTLGKSYIDPTPPTPPTPPEEGKLYKVQVGAFSNRANAEALVNDLKSKGYSGFIVESIK